MDDLDWWRAVRNDREMKIPEGARRGEFNVLCSLIHRVAEFADREYQRAIWLEGEGPEVSSYSDAMLGVLDDASQIFGDLGLHYGLTREQTTALEEFRDALRRFQDKVRESDWKGDDLYIISDSEWPKIVDLAAKTTSLCKKWRESNCGPDGYSLANFDLPE
jgi:hypothetical protein